MSFKQGDINLTLLILALVFSAVSTFPIESEAATLENVGFVKSDLWFSKEPFFEGEKVRVFTALHNSSEKSVKGTIGFYANGVRFGYADFSIQPAGAQVIYAEWTAISGDHLFSARIEKSEARSNNEEWAPVDIEFGQTGEENKFVDLDTDGDGIGNLSDTDDDGDGLSDTNDSEPLVAFVQSTQSTRTTPQQPDGFVEKTVEIIKGRVVPVVQDITEKTLVETEKFREEQLGKTEKRVAQIEARIETLPISNETETGRANKAQIEETELSLIDRLRNFAAGAGAITEGGVKSPFQYVSLWAQKLLLVILKYKPVFYSLGAILLLLIIRSIFRRIF